MDAMQEFEAAKEKIRLADHILTINYSVSDEPKLFLSVILDIKEAIGHIINIFIIKEGKSTEITFDEKSDFYKENVMVKYSLPSSYANMIDEVKTIFFEHENSPMEFARKEKYVICDDDYAKIKSIDLKQARELLTKAKLFIVDISNYAGDKLEQ